MSQQGESNSRTLTVFGKDINPWSPDIDPRRSDKSQIISLQNVLDDVDGPRSWGSSQFYDFNFWDVATRKKFQELPINDGMLYGTCTGVYYIDNVSGIAVPLLTIATNNGLWPWTIAYVGGLYYLAQYDIGLWQFDPVAWTITHIDTPAGDTIRGVAESFGRLIYLTDTVVADSALDDGTDLVPSLITAASAQALSIVGGTAYKIVPIPDGFLVYMSAGIIKGTYTQAAYVFQYTKLTEAIKLFSPNGAIYVPRVGSISIDNAGLSLTREMNYQDNGIPQPWQPIMSDYIKKNILNTLNPSLYGTLSMFFSQVEQKLFISFSSNAQEGLMSTTFVFNLINQRFGSFDHVNTGIFETYDATNNIYTCSYMGDDGYIRALTNTDFSEGQPLENNLPDYVFRPMWSEKPVNLITDASDTVFELGTTDILFSSDNPFFYSSYTQFGTFTINDEPYSDVNNDDAQDPPMVIANPIIGGSYINMDKVGGVELFAIPFQLPSIGLDSQLVIGPWRFTDAQYPDETSSVDSILVGIAPTTNFSVSADWGALTGTVDWGAIGGKIDWGFGTGVPNVFTLTLRDTDDSVNPPIQDDEILPVLNNLGSALKYAPMGWSSIYHTLTLTAENPNEAFALKTLDITGLQTGRLSQVG